MPELRQEMQVQLDTGCSVQGFIDTAPLSAVSTAVTGQNLNGDKAPVAKWLGVPYATPAERWKRISSPAVWEGVRECYEFGPIPMQPSPGPPLEAVWDTAPGYHLREHIPQSEHCSSANVFKPARVAAATGGQQALPVFVFI
jgi:carboxylesterase type B